MVDMPTFSSPNAQQGSNDGINLAAPCDEDIASRGAILYGWLMYFGYGLPYWAPSQQQVSSTSSTKPTQHTPESPQSPPPCSENDELTDARQHLVPLFEQEDEVASHTATAAAFCSSWAPLCLG
ncbi:hypothetical protein MY1884_005686 [Beauveria asiatica]